MTIDKTYHKLMRALTYHELMCTILESDEYYLESSGPWFSPDGEGKIYLDHIHKNHWDVDDFILSHLEMGHDYIDADDAVEFVKDTCDWLKQHNKEQYEEDNI